MQFQYKKQQPLHAPNASRAVYSVLAWLLLLACALLASAQCAEVLNRLGHDITK
jgi:hypothetical protein